MCQEIKAKIWKVEEGQTKEVKIDGNIFRRVEQIKTTDVSSPTDSPIKGLPVPLNMKQCRKCSQVKPKDEFNKKTRSKDGLQSYCKDCQKTSVATKSDETKNKKTCNTCNVEKPLSDFYKAKDGKHGREAVCKLCRNKQNRERYNARKKQEQKQESQKIQEQQAAQEKTPMEKYKELVDAAKQKNTHILMTRGIMNIYTTIAAKFMKFVTDTEWFSIKALGEIFKNSSVSQRHRYIKEYRSFMVDVLGFKYEERAGEKAQLYFRFAGPFIGQMQKQTQKRIVVEEQKPTREPQIIGESEKKTKACIKCGVEKQLEEFPKDKKYKDGRRNVCRKCTNARIEENRRKKSGKKKSKLKVLENKHAKKLYEKYTQKVHVAPAKLLIQHFNETSETAYGDEELGQKIKTMLDDSKLYEETYERISNGLIRQYMRLLVIAKTFDYNKKKKLYTVIRHNTIPKQKKPLGFLERLGLK